MRNGGFWEENRIYRFFSVLLLSGITLFAGGAFLGVKEAGIREFLVVLLTVFLIMCLKGLSLKGRFLALFFLLVCLASLASLVGLREVGAFFGSYGKWLVGKGAWEEEWLSGYRFLQLIVLSVFCYFLQVILEKCKYLKPAAAVVSGGALIVCLYQGIELSRIGVALIFCYLALIYVEWQQSRWKKIHSGRPKQYMLWILPFFAFYFLLLILTPAPRKPYQWQWVKDAYRAVKEAVLTATQNLARGEREDFGVTFSGFSEDGELHGDFLESDRELMTIRSSAKLLTNVYLTGTVYDTFSGRGWEKNDEQTYRDRYLDTMETLAAIRIFDKEYQLDYLRESSLTLYYRYLHTSYLFLPLKLNRIEDERGNFLPLSAGQQLFGEQKGYGTEYEARYFQMNADQEAFYEFLENAGGWDETVLLEIMRNYGAAAGVSPDAGIFEEYRGRIYELYQKRPSLSTEMEAYLQEITRGAGTDLEKLMYIEEALSSLTYTRTPGGLPDGVRDERSFLDYFLLEKGEGYCTHFATAFVLLARAEGFPARYVQGFCVPMKGCQEASVTSGMAHAWPEVYLEGIGWIPFEPTPGYEGVRYTAWSMQHRKGEGEDEPEISAEEQLPQDFENADEMLMQEEGEKGEHEGLGRMRQAVKILGLAVPAVLTVCVLMLLLERIAGSRRYRRMDWNQKLQWEVWGNLRILAWLGIKRGDTETLQELGQRTKAVLEGESFTFFDTYEGILYGGKGASAEMVKKVRAEREILLEILKKRRWWVYLYFFFIFLE